MKICITSQGNNLESPVDPRFGRCGYFIVVDPDTMVFEAIDNANTGSSGGAGVRAGQFMSEKGVEAVLTGNAGPNAFQTLNAAKIKLITGVSGSVKDAIEKYNSGELRPADSASVDSHFGKKGGD